MIVLAVVSSEKALYTVAALHVYTYKIICRPRDFQCYGLRYTKMHGPSYQYRGGATTPHKPLTFAIIVHAHVLVVSHARVIHVTSHVVVRCYSLCRQGTLVHGPPSDKRVALDPLNRRLDQAHPGVQVSILQRFTSPVGTTTCPFFLS